MDVDIYRELVELSKRNVLEHVAFCVSLDGLFNRRYWYSIYAAAIDLRRVFPLDFVHCFYETEGITTWRGYVMRFVCWSEKRKRYELRCTWSRDEYAFERLVGMLTNESEWIAYADYLMLKDECLEVLDA